MRDHAEEFCVEKMAEVLGVSRSGYYDFLERKVGTRAEENERLLKQIKTIYQSSRGVYGSPRIHRELRNQGDRCSRRRIARLMRREGIQAKMRKRWKMTTRPNEKAEANPNHLNQKFRANEPDRIWVSDITYITTQEGWLYVAIVMDLFSRKIVGLSMGERLQTELVTNALKQALMGRDIKAGLIHHSDRGCQYTSKEFKELASRHDIQLSMSGKGHCFDNAVAESFFHTLKTEHTNFNNYKIREEAKNSIFEYVEVFYNRKRLHSTIEYLPPEEFENRWKKASQKAA